jgi:hypothetical protein
MTPTAHRIRYSEGSIGRSEGINGSSEGINGIQREASGEQITCVDDWLNDGFNENKNLKNREDALANINWLFRIYTMIYII